MRITYGQRSIGLEWFPLIIYVIVVIFPMELGQTFLHGPPELSEEPLEGQRKISAGIAIFLTLVRFKKLPPFLRNVFIVAMAYICIIALESFYTYGTFFIYPHVFGKFFVLFSCMAVYVFFRGAKEWVYTASLMIMVSFFLWDLLVHYPDVLSLGSFMEIERGLHASTVMFLMCAWLYAFNSYLPTLKVHWLLVFFALSALILFLNHRTVWLASISCMSMNLFLINTKGKERYSGTAFTPIILVPLIAVVLVFAYVFSEKPELLANITDRIVDIKKADQQGTGKWRIQQFTSYLPFIFDHPFFGMRFSGFELPVQFIAEQTGKEVFTADTGHHFHSYYVDSLFYHGLLGLTILSSVFVYTFYRMITYPVKVPFRLIGLAIWAGICMQYGLSYPLDDFHFAMAGFALAALDTNLDNVDAERTTQLATQNNALAYQNMLEEEYS